MKNIKEKKYIKKALSSLKSGDIVNLKRNIKEALLHKVKKAINIKEKRMAKTLLKNVTENYNIKSVLSEQKVTVIIYPENKKLIVSSAKELASKVKLKPEDLFLRDEDEKIFNDALKSSSVVYGFVDPYNEEMGGIPSMSFRKDKNQAMKDYKDSAEDV